MTEDLFTLRWSPLINEQFGSESSVIPTDRIHVSLIQLVGKDVITEIGLGVLAEVNFQSFVLPPAILGEWWLLSFKVPQETGAGFHVEQFPVKIVRRSKDRWRISSRSRFIFDRIPRELVSPDGRIPGPTRHVIRQFLLSKRLRLRPPREKKRGKWFPKFPQVTEPSIVSFPVNYVKVDDGVVVDDVSTTFDVTLRSKSVVRTLTPNFFSLKKWERPVNPYSLLETNYSTRMGYQRIEYIDLADRTTLSWAGPTDYFSAPPAPDLNHNPGAREKAFRYLLKEIGREDFNLAADLVQFNQATRMISKNLTSILRAYKAVKRLDFVTASNALFGTRPHKFRRNGGPSARKRVSENWLEYQYGWKPLLADIADTIEAVHRSYHPSLRTARAKGTVTSFTSTTLNGPFGVSLNGVAPFPAGMRVTVKRSKCQIGIQYRVSDADKLFLSQTGFTSPLSLAWEILPFSFVVDWCYPLGPYLERLTAFDGLTFVGGFESYKTVETTGLLLNHEGIHGISPLRVSISCRGGAQRKSVKFERVKLFAFPEVPKPALKNPISVVHAANALALVVANMSKV